MWSGGEVKGFTPEAGAKATARSPLFAGQGRGAKVPEVTGPRPEAARSSPGQGEAARKRRGSPIGVLAQAAPVTRG